MQRAGYSTGFLTLAGIAVSACLIFWRFVPETNHSDKTASVLQKA